jgi:hypothetical protein
MPRALDEAKTRDEDPERPWASSPPGGRGSADPGDARSGSLHGVAPAIWWAGGFDTPLAAAISGASGRRRRQVRAGDRG